MATPRDRYDAPAPVTVPVPRRAALKLSAIVAAALAFPAAAQSAALAAPAPAGRTATVTLAADPGGDFGAWLAEWRRQYAAAGTARRALGERFRATLSAEQLALYLELEGEESEESVLEGLRTWELVARHLPGLAPALRLVVEHAQDTRFGDEEGCCAATAP